MLLLGGCTANGTDETTPNPTKLRSDLISTPWNLTRQEGRTLFVLVASGGCVSFDHVDVEEGDRTVTLTALGKRNKVKGSTVCTAERELEVVAVCLDAPLGDRELVHAPISDGWGGRKRLEVTFPPRFGEPEPCR